MTNAMTNDHTAEATVRWNSGHVTVERTLSDGRVVEEMIDRRLEREDEQSLHKLIEHFRYGAQCGEGGAELNLEQDGFIEMIFGHVAGKMNKDDNWWRDCRWAITAKGVHASTEKLTASILRDPPMSVVEADADEELDDINVYCSDPTDPDDWDDTADNRARLEHLNDRVERIRRREVAR